MARTKNRFQAVEIRPPEEIISVETKWRAGLYARLSRSSERTGSESIENQLELMRNHLKEKQEIRIIGEYVDDGVSGTRMSRPAFDTLMEDLRSGKINAVIVKDMSRLGRDYLETSNLVETIFPFLGVRFISVNDHFDTEQDANGNKDLEIALKNLVNDMYAKDTSRRISLTRQQDRERGKATNVEAPYGYKVDREHPLHQYMIDPQAAAIVQEIYTLALEDTPLREISRILQERGLSIPGLYKKTGSLYLREEDEQKQWYIGTISSILKNRAYIGDLVQGKRRSALYEGKKQHAIAPEEWSITENAHPPIITRESFQQVQEKLKERAGDTSFSSERLKNIPVKANKYQQILFCGICGGSLSYLASVRNSNHGRHYAFQCRNKRDRGEEGGCGVYIVETVLDGLVRQSVGDLIRSFDGGCGAFTRIMENAAEEHSVDMTGEIRKLEKQIAVQDREEEEAYEMLVQGNLSREQYEKIRETVSEKRTQQIHEKQEQENRLQEYRTNMQRKREWLLGLELFSEGEPDQDLLRQLIKRINLYPGRNLEIIYRFNIDEIRKEV